MRLTMHTLVSLDRQTDADSVISDAMTQSVSLMSGRAQAQCTIETSPHVWLLYLGAHSLIVTASTA